MKTAVLFSGGKDSCLALTYALKFSEVVCLITLESENPYSYMFHTPNIVFAKKQAEAIGLPILIKKTKGEKEKELNDLEDAIKEAKEKYKIDGIVTGAVASVYQSSRIQKICEKLNLKCLNPLWQKDQFKLLEELIKNKFEVIIVGVFALGMETFLERIITKRFVEDIRRVYEKYQVSPAGEGGEFESFVLNAPFFKKRIKILKSHVEKDNNSAVLKIDVLKLI
jgi:ABC transporter with metal-binding/Fe-S-binding domain ATP-binding protein